MLLWYFVGKTRPAENMDENNGSQIAAPSLAHSTANHQLTTTEIFNFNLTKDN
jgi:hypothetical protein